MNKALSLLLIAILVTTTSVLAQTDWRNYSLKGSKKGAGINIFVGVPSTKIEFTTTDSKFDPFTGAQLENTTKQALTNKSAMAYQIDLPIPIARLSEVSALGMDIAFYMNSFSWTHNKISVIKDGTTYTNNTGLLEYTDMGLPIGVSYFRGADAVGDKSYKMAYSVGVGLIPIFDAFKYNSSFNQTHQRIRPYIKGEFGFFAGILWKFRASATFGSRNILARAENSGNEGRFLAAGRAQVRIGPIYTVGLAIYPFSFMYNKSMWWR